MRTCYLYLCQKSAGPSTMWVVVDDYGNQTPGRFFCTKKHAEKYFDGDDGIGNTRDLLNREGLYLCQILSVRKEAKE